MTVMSADPVARGAAFLPGLGEDEFGRLPRGEPAAISARREAAFARYAAIPVPTPRDEEWRRTDPALIPFGGHRRMPDLVRDDRPAPAGAWDNEFDVVVIVSDRRLGIRDRSGAIARGDVVVTDLRDAARSAPDLLAACLGGEALNQAPRKLALAADAFWNAGLFVHVRPGKVLEGGVLIRHEHGADGGLFLPRFLVVVGAGAQARIVEHYASAEDISFLTLGLREFYVGENAALDMVSLEEWGGGTVHVGEDWARVDRDGRINWITLTLGGKVSKMAAGCDVCAPNAQAHLSGLFFADGTQHVDQKTLQLHSSPHTRSYLLYKGAVKDAGHSVYQGTIQARPGAIDVDAYQMNNNLILSEGARADSLPGLEIDADDLKCSHGATTGTLDPEQIFYLRSRGLSETEAKQMVVTAFFEEVVAKVPYEFIREKLRGHIGAKVAEAVGQR
jgi:Fe-S cluster assembly protein SufD